jgi:peroxiredoxin-like protein
MSNFHDFPVTVEWEGGTGGSGRVFGELSEVEYPIAVPKVYRGTGLGVSPEEGLTSAIASCYTIIVGIMAQGRKLPVVRFETKASGSVEMVGQKLFYRSIALRPKAFVTSEFSDEHEKALSEIFNKAEEFCPVTQAVSGNVKIYLTPEIERL